mgnify:CR=1 FL=1
MKQNFSRRDFLKLSAAALSGLVFPPVFPPLEDFDDSNLVRVATKSVSVHSQADDSSRIVSQLYRDELVRVYDLVKAEKPEYNPYWYRVWSGYVHRARLQPVKVLYNRPLDAIPAGERRLAEVTVPFAQPWRFTKARGWEMLNFRLYFESVHWIDGLDQGPDGQAWYRVFDELVSIPYYVPAIYLRPIPHEELAPISPEIPWENKRIEVNLTTQTLTAFEYDKPIFATRISSGIIAGRSNPKQISTKTPNGEFHIEEKMPSKHMGNGNLFAGTEDYELPGVSWTCFFTPAGHAFHGTYWHDNFGVPMSRGCINMRTAEARWLFRWVRPPHTVDDLDTKYYFRGYGTPVKIFY